ncbi:MAG: DNA gyrase subunit A, partial [Gammaproteobacteria bacterium]|nr:DNA gyrase subunit A [Gammaproteobacteria bacterium]
NVFGINMVALVKGQPRLLDLKTILESFIIHRREVVTRRTVFDLRKARDRAHLLEGLAIALSNIDEIIALIKQSPSPAVAKAGLLEKSWAPGVVMDMLQRAGADSSRPEDIPDACGLVDDQYRLTERQAQAILDLRLHKLTGLEQDKIISEYREILEKIEDLLDILQRDERLKLEIRLELEAIREQFSDDRRTEILIDHSDLTVEDLISEEDVVVTISHLGYAKAQPLESYSAQRRGGRGKAATKVKDEDFVEQMFAASTHDTLLCFSTRGKVYWQKVYQLPIGSRTARGRPMVNLLPLEPNERITAILPVRDYPEDQFIFFATASGKVKRTSLASFSRPRANGIIALDLRDDDSLIGAQLTAGESDLMLFTSAGKGIRIAEKDVRAMGRTAAGVRGIKVKSGDEVISLIAIDSDEGEILFATENGYGKRTRIKDFSTQGRGGQGVISIKTSTRNGRVIGAIRVTGDEEIMLISNAGTLVRTPVDGISILARNTQGVTLIRVGEDEQLVQIEPVAASVNGEDSDDESELVGE